MRDESEYVRAVDECPPAEVEGAKAPIDDKSGDCLPGYVPDARGFGL